MAAHKWILLIKEYRGGCNMKEPMRVHRNEYGPESPLLISGGRGEFDVTVALLWAGWQWRLLWLSWMPVCIWWAGIVIECRCKLSSKIRSKVCNRKMRKNQGTAEWAERNCVAAQCQASWNWVGVYRNVVDWFSATFRRIISWRRYLSKRTIIWKH